ncbi:MAG: hypothetical protein JJU12_01485 [Chlamydiales bacterium]|nr:hypothetical protein [Chlamydiales bacterium]
MARKPPCYNLISEVYKFDFFQIPMGQNTTHFFDIRELILQIEMSIHKNPTQKNTFPSLQTRISLRTRIKELLHGSLPHCEKMGELGMILFYLDHPNHPFPHDAKSLISYRAKEIEHQVAELIKSHPIADERVPTGKTHYLLRAFAHMAMTSTQVYNRGGLYALLSILESPQYGVTNYLRPEHHEHIVIVAKQVLANHAFSGLFGRKITVHPDLEDAIRIDLKLNPKDALSSTHLFWDCFMFLFHDIRQINRPNCYAIGALIYAIENAPYKTLEKMVSWLEGGYFKFNEQIGIPIAPLLEKRLFYKKDLDIKLEIEKASSLSTFKHIHSILNINGCPKEHPESVEAAPLQKALNTIVYSQEKSDCLPYAAKLYYAYKYNILIHLALAVMEFAYLNYPETGETQKAYSENKEKFFNKIIHEVEESLTSFSNQTCKSILLNKIRTKLGERLWFESCSEIEVRKINDGVKVGEKEFVGFKGNCSSLVSVFEDSMRLFYLEGNEYALLERITDFQSAVRGIVGQVEKELREEERKIYPSILFSKVKFRVTSRGFALGIAKYAASQIAQKGISGYHLRAANLLLFEQKGGRSNEVLQRVLGLQVAIQQISGAMTPYEFLGKLLNVLDKLDRSLFQATPRILVYTLGEHIWTLSPNRLRLFFNPTSTFYNFIQKTIFNPANARMRGRIPAEILSAVINRYTGSNKELRSELQEYFKEIHFHSLTYERVRSDLLNKATNYKLAKKIIDEEFAKIPKTQINLKKTIQNLNITVKAQTTHQMEISLNIEPTRILPYQLALLLRKQLIFHKIAVIDPYDLELAICHAHKLPLIFDLGDLNWEEGKNREDPSHLHLVLRYNSAERSLSFYHRDSKGERQTSKKEFERFQIQHPEVKPSPNQFW